MLIHFQLVALFNNTSFHELHSETEGQYFPEIDYLILPVMNVNINEPCEIAKKNSFRKCVF